QAWRRGRLRLWQAAVLTPPTYLLWANLHNGVALGFASLLFFAIGDMAERLRLYPFDPADPEIEGRPQQPGAYLLLAAVAAAGSLVNPYGLGTFAHLADYSSTKYLVDIINETQSPDFHFPHVGMFLLLVCVTVAPRPRATRAIAAGDLLPLALFTAATFSMQRMVVWAVLFYVLILPRALHHCWTAPGAGEAGIVAALRRSTVAVRRGGAAVGRRGVRRPSPSEA